MFAVTAILSCVIKIRGLFKSTKWRHFEKVKFEALSAWREKVEAGKRLAAINCKKREVKKREEQAKLEKTASKVNQYYGFGTILALGVIGGFGYYIYWSKKGEQPWGCCAALGPEGSSNPQQNNPKPCHKVIPAQLPSGCSQHKLTSLRWIKSLLY